MIEITIRDYLQTRTNVEIDLERPKTVPAEYVLMIVESAGKSNHIDAVTISFICRSDSLYKAALLSEDIQKYLEESIEYIPCISKAQIGGKASDIMPGVYQYTLTFNFYFYKEETLNE